jgi:dihydroxy-acid dehydratase
VQTTSGSTNAALHLSAIANEAQLPIRVMDIFSQMYHTTPILAKVNPSAAYDMEDFYKAGGVPRVMRCLEDLVEGDAMTCTGKTVAENLAQYRPIHFEDTQIIRTRDNVYQSTGGVAVLKGNLAQLSAVTKPGAYAPALRHFTGPARVFDQEEAANEAILNGEIKAGTILVIRYEGPRGGPGMREMYKAMKYLYGQGLAQSTAVITDGRFSGTNNGCFVGHISPEAAEGGTLALVEDGDVVEINVDAGTLTLHVDDALLAARRAAWKAPEQDIPRGYLRTYAKLASSADQGAILY